MRGLEIVQMIAMKDLFKILGTGPQVLTALIIESSNALSLTGRYGTGQSSLNLVAIDLSKKSQPRI